VLRSPNLDDRTFDDLFAAAKARALTVSPDWEFTPSDPGTVLLELFAFLTEVLIYRVNRIPEKAYIEFLGLLGVQVLPPAAASVDLVFRRNSASNEAVEIPRGTRVTGARNSRSEEPPVFVTAHSARIEAAAMETTVRGWHAELVAGELAGYGTGGPRLSIPIRRAPVVAETNPDLALIVGVETPAQEVEARTRSLRLDEKVYRVWEEVPGFSNLPPDSLAYVVDRVSGVISFAPAVRMKQDDGSLDEKARLLAAVPERGREVRLWYWRGGGVAGNVAENILTVLKDPIPGVTVTNPARAAGGRAGETLENALVRGPEEFRSLERAVTAGDFEALALKSGSISRVKAFTRARLWMHATPGTVEVLLVPNVPADQLSRPLEAPLVEALHSENARGPITAILDERKPLGTTCLVNWARYKTVRVSARIVTYREEDAQALGKRVETRLYQTINPVAWRFGQALRASHIYDLVLAEPGVNYVDRVSFQMDDVPNGEVGCLVRDIFQPKTWHAASGDSLFRTVNDGEGWERTRVFPDEQIRTIAVSRDRAGLVAAATIAQGLEPRSTLTFSFDAGETWASPISVAFEVFGMAWMLRESVPVLLVATAVGLYEIAMETAGDATPQPLQILVDGSQPDRGFGAVTVASDVRGQMSVAVATLDKGGIFLSSQAGRPSTFRQIGLDNEDVRVLVSHYDGPRVFLWAGFATAGGAAGTGAARAELLGSEVAAGGWERFQKDWRGGSCWSLAFQGGMVYAASYQAGVLRLDTALKEPVWVVPDISCGLPQRGMERIFQWVKTVATTPQAGVLMCGGLAGVYRSQDGGITFREVSSPVHTDKVTAPETWLFCSGRHEIEVVEESHDGS
jgi:hypothetical protein